MANETTKVMSAKNLQKVTTSQRITKIIVTTAVYLFLGIMALIVLFPFYWMIISSLKDLEEYMRPVPTLFPETIHFSTTLTQ